MQSQAADVVQIRQLSKTFGQGDSRVEALRGVSLDVRRGEFVAVMGPSGSGKSTLLHLAAGLEPPSGGTVCIGGRDLARLSDDELTLLRRRQIGLIFQAFNLIGVLTAEENVALPLLIDGVRESEAHRRAARCLGLVGLDGRRNHLPAELSGGEQQRVAVARALVTDPLLLLADEPTGNLDSASGDQVIHLLGRLVEQEGQTILMVTHNPQHAAAAHRVLHLSDGRIVADAAPPPDVHERTTEHARAPEPAATGERQEPARAPTGRGWEAAR